MILISGISVKKFILQEENGNGFSGVAQKQRSRARDKDANPRPFQGLSVECTREFMTRDMNVTMNPNLGTATKGSRKDFDFNLISREANRGCFVSISE